MPESKSERAEREYLEGLRYEDKFRVEDVVVADSERAATAWLTCNCSCTAPTMPTCRDKHLPSCPMAAYELVRFMERQNAEMRAALPEPVQPKRGRRRPDVDRAILSAEAMTLRAIRAVMEGQPVNACGVRDRG